MMAMCMLMMFSILFTLVTVARRLKRIERRLNELT